MKFDTEEDGKARIWKKMSVGTTSIDRLLHYNHVSHTHMSVMCVVVIFGFVCHVYTEVHMSHVLFCSYFSSCDRNMHVPGKRVSYNILAHVMV